MKRILLEKNKVDLCYKNNCISLKGDWAKLAFGTIAFVLVVSTLNSLLESSK